MTKEYPLASSERERRRLKMQSEALVPLTERMLAAAGIASGSRVLELGCGSGEVTKLIASRIGPGGEVVAVDRDESQVAAAAQQLRNHGHDNVRHVVSDIESFEPTGAFDAVVGRYVLIYVASPESVLRKAAKWLRPGGCMAFIEMDLFRGVRSRIWPPPSAKTNRAIEFIGDTMLDAGIHADMGARLPSMLSYYGRVESEVDAPMQFGAASIELPLEAVRSVQPIARRLGRTDADEHDVDRLLFDEMNGRDDHTVTIPPVSIAAWVRI
jgi:SAM-dependent methyltransferase